MEVSGLWRYPVKSLAGEALDVVALTRDGISGDRIVHVVGPRGPLTGRTRYGLLTIAARTGAGGVPHVAGFPWDTPAAAAVVREHAGSSARLVAYDGPERFDVLNLLIATDGAVRRFGHDIRRLRPNLLISGVDAGAEATWPGQALAMGDALVGIHSVRDRCVVTTIDPDSGAQDLDVLRGIRDVFGGRLALNSWVIEPGRVRMGDRVELVPTGEQPTDVGGWVAGAAYHHPEPVAGLRRGRARQRHHPRT